jgi:hypothetical protein
MPREPLQTLLAQLIDYAGLFPPAGLSMADAVAEFARQRQSAESFMLARFVVPTSRLDEFEQAAEPHLPRQADGRPWGLSVLPGDDLDAARERIDAFNETHGQAENGLAKVESVEYRPPEIMAIPTACRTFGGLELYLELPWDENPDPLMRVVSESGGRAKIRTGGVTEDAFPPAPAVTRFLFAAHQHQVLMKATAGLHHPLRGVYRLTYEPESPEGLMHGFLNVFLAAVAVRSVLTEPEEVTELLEERDVAAFTFHEGGVSWRDHDFDLEILGEARKNLCLSYGSCSFAEPVEELAKLGLSPA